MARSRSVSRQVQLGKHVQAKHEPDYLVLRVCRSHPPHRRSLSRPHVLPLTGEFQAVVRRSQRACRPRRDDGWRVAVVSGIPPGLPQLRQTRGCATLASLSVVLQTPGRTAKVYDYQNPQSHLLWAFFAFPFSQRLWAEGSGECPLNLHHATPAPKSVR